MRDPELVGRCVAAMKDKVQIPITVKCRIGVDDQDPVPALDNLAKQVWTRGCDSLWVHARKAWLEGLSPKENREIPPLDYNRVYDLKSENTDKFIGINGGIENLEQAVDHLKKMDGVMLGRVAYQNPDILRQVDNEIFGSQTDIVSAAEVMQQMCDYSEQHLVAGGRLNQITRHMIGLFHGIPGARRYRQILSVESVKEDAGPEVIDRAFRAVDLNSAAAA